MYAKRHTIAVTTDGSGDATAYSQRITGRIETIRFVNTDFAATADFTITAETTGETIWTESNVAASKTCKPEATVQSTAGVDRTFDGTYTVSRPVVLANERIKFIVAQGGDTKTGTFYVTVS